MKEFTIITKSEKETFCFGYALGHSAADGLFIALTGDLGAGKTHFTQGLAAGMGVKGAVTSPTFNIMNIYDGKLPLKHFDFYRLDTAEDLYNIGWEEYGTGGVIAAEWAEKFPELIPDNAIYMDFGTVSMTERKIHVRIPGNAPETAVREIISYAACH